jgi:hypothetical protein
MDLNDHPTALYLIGGWGKATRALPRNVDPASGITRRPAGLFSRRSPAAAAIERDQHEGQRDGEGMSYHQRIGRDEEVPRLESKEMRLPRVIAPIVIATTRSAIPKRLRL